MQVLIVVGDPNLGWLWKRHIERIGAQTAVVVVTSQDDAISYLRHHKSEIVVLDLVLSDGSAIAIADYAAYRHPAAKVIFVTNSSFFSDGSIFQHIPNACSFLPRDTPPGDLAAIVDHYGMDAR
ncbi:MAG: response regulator transcription factor [Rhodobacteraceae bacterium]|nr:response regulator transcription factor [Paracoccaceae bacterium]